jgi:hypothetical protein
MIQLTHSSPTSLAFALECLESPLRLTLGVRLTETELLGYSVPQLIQLPDKQGPIGFSENSEPRIFGSGYFGSVSVLTERNRSFQQPRKQPIQLQILTAFPLFFQAFNMDNLNNSTEDTFSNIQA